MGLIDQIMSKAMVVKWIPKGENDRIMSPEWYLAVEINYKNPVQKTKAEIIDEEKKAISMVSDMFKGLPAQSRMISGAVSLDLLLGHKPETSHTNLDMIFIPQVEVLTPHFEAAKKQEFYPMWRISLKTKKESDIKYHLFHPTYPAELLVKRGYTHRHPELTRINTAASMIQNEFSLLNHIKLHLHKPAPGGFICTEDKKHIIYPKEFLKGVPVEVNGERLYVVDPRYTHIKLNDVVKNKEHNYQKHLPYLTRLEVFLRDNAKDFPIKGFNC
jgi:hypothetical protein